ncbi:MAG: rRNA maturation RNase YbeY [Lachnospiraceae bacterium]|nr:rRNA maturation RNase YbeY [Lachnospiraceae bacterium]
MKLTINNECSVKFPFKPGFQAKKIIEAALTVLEVPYEAQLEVCIADEDYVADLNKRYRDIDSTTDCLSFPMVDYDAPLDFSYVERNPGAYLDPETGAIMLGDIVICAQRVFSQALEYGHAPLREFDFLIVHSLLHLLGYDHIDDNDRIKMEKIQKEILERAGITR